MSNFMLKPAVFATLAAFSASVFAAGATVLEDNKVYDTINTPDGFIIGTNSTVTSADGKFVTGGARNEIDPNGKLYLNNENAEITSAGNFFVSEGAQIKQNAEKNLQNLTFAGGSMTLSKAHLTVDGTLTYSSASPKNRGSYIRVEQNSSLTVDHFVASTYYSISNKGGTVTIRDLEAAGMVTNDNGVFNITETANVGHFWNLATVNAEDAVIEVSPNEGMMPMAYDDVTIFKNQDDGRTYVFGNGIDEKQNNGDKDYPTDTNKASMNVGTLIVHGNAINTAESSLDATNLQVDETLRNDQSSSVNITDGVANVGNVVGEDGFINLDNAAFAVNGDSDLGTVTANQSAVVFNAGDSRITTFSGEDKSIWLTSTEATATVVNKDGNMSVNTTGAVNDQHSSVQETLAWLNDAVTVENGERTGDNLVILQGDVNDGMVLRFNEKGELEVVSTQTNTRLDAYGSVAALGIMQWRHENTDLVHRMGELRDSAQGVGTWARVYGSEQEYGSQNLTSKNTSVQVGADFDVGYGWKVGAAFTYTDGSADYNAGDADNKAYSVAAYGTWLAENGQYVDLIAKYSRLGTDFNLEGMSGDYDNNAFSVAAEYGWHWRINESAFIEPQIGVTYGRIMGENFIAGNGVTLEQDDFDSLTGKVGIRAGFHFPEDKGTIYARVAGVHDFQGDFDVTAKKGVAVNSIHDDLGDTWVEFGFGANFNWTENTYTYVDLERANGGEVKENWRWNVGLRHTF